MEAQGFDLAAILIYAIMCALVLDSVGVVVVLVVRRRR